MSRLRPATQADDDFCFGLNEACLREYVEPIYGWDPEIQRAYHEAWFRPDRLSIIVDEAGDAIGVLDVSDRGDHLYLSRLEIVPAAQGQGVGTLVVQELISQGRPIRLHTFTNNPRARRFYERLGFEVESDADREHHISMRHP